MKDKILWTITSIAFMVFMLGASALDSEDLTVPFLMVGISGAWLFLFGIANEGNDFE